MYRSKPNLILGFHGCEKEDQQKLHTDISYFKESNQIYDWLGHGMYFWEGNEKRALEWAEKKKNARTLKEPAIIGAVIDLGRCFDLFDSSNIKTLQEYYLLFKSDLEKSGMKIPENKDHPKEIGDKVLRELDCAVIEYMHTVIKEDKKLAPFDSVRASFTEGQPIYPGAGFLDKTHIQICIINPNCIKGVFLPRKNSQKFREV